MSHLMHIFARKSFLTTSCLKNFRENIPAGRSRQPWDEQSRLVTQDFCCSRSPQLQFPWPCPLETTKKAALWDLLPRTPTKPPQYQTMTDIYAKTGSELAKLRRRREEKNKDNTPLFSHPLSAGPKYSQDCSRMATPSLPPHHTEDTGGTTSA